MNTSGLMPSMCSHKKDIKYIDPGDRLKILFDMFHNLYTNTKFGVKIFEIDFIIEIK